VDASTAAAADSIEDQDQPAEPKSKKQRRGMCVPSFRSLHVTLECYSRPSVCAAGERTFDISKFQRRHVALHVAYVGWQYQGLARQADTDRTIEVIQGVLTGC
jgi:hypothetical protein